MNPDGTAAVGAECAYRPNDWTAWRVCIISRAFDSYGRPCCLVLLPDGTTGTVELAALEVLE